jgi:hypothetical protein
VTVSFDITDVAIDRPAGRATASLVAHVSGGSGELERVDASEWTVDLVKTDGAWLIARATRVPVLRR